jgi:RNA polymerase sigma-70 factor (sigma-E family)
VARVPHDDEFDEFAAAAWPRLRWTAYLLVGDRHLAEDLAQTALVRTYASWRRVRRDDAMAYARRVLVNVNIDRLRRRSTHEVPIGQAPPEVPGSTRDPVADRDALVRLLGGLTDAERKVVVLRYLYDLTEPMVAAELGVTVGTVKSTTSRALAKLRSSAAGAAPAGGSDPHTDTDTDTDAESETTHARR